MKHALKADGAAFSATTLTRVDPSSTKGQGVAVCACGATSINLPTRSARKSWFAEHKAQPELDREVDEAMEAAAEAEVELDEPEAEEDLIGEPEPEPKPEASKKSRKKAAQKAEEAEAAPEAQPTATRRYTSVYGETLAKFGLARAEANGITAKRSGKWFDSVLEIYGTEEEAEGFLLGEDGLDAEVFRVQAEAKTWRKAQRDELSKLSGYERLQATRKHILEQA